MIDTISKDSTYPSMNRISERASMESSVTVLTANRRAYGNIDRATCLLACRDERLEGRQLGCKLSLGSTECAFAKLDFFQSAQESAIKWTSVISKLTEGPGDEEIIHVLHSEHLDTGELQKEFSPQDTLVQPLNLIESDNA